MDLQFYPTPLELAERLTKQMNKVAAPILEPSAGNGDLIQGFIQAHRYGNRAPRYSNEHFHCIELDPNRAATLKGNGFKVVWDDFMTFNPLLAYQTIIMNPPFNDGAHHLLKALNILADGGQIACILNAETIKNPYSNDRKVLLQTLEAMDDYKCEFVQSAFDGTDVECALIYAKKKAATVRCATFDNFMKSVVEERSNNPQQLMRHGEENALIDTYRATVKTALHLFDDVNALNSIFKAKDSYEEIFEWKNRFASRYDVVKKINMIFWRRLYYSQELARLFTCDVQRAYSSKLNEMCEYEFNERNILQLKMDLTKDLFTNVDAAIMKVWSNFTSRFSLNEYSQNIHYYNGWKTNKAFRCNKKVIIPLYAFNSWHKELELYRVRDELADIEKVMNYLDNGRTEDSDMANKIDVAQKCGITRGIDTKFFTVDVYKKGTCHLTFKDSELLKKFNIYCGKKLNWLPDDYGRKPYDSLDDDEREVADSFEGRDSYNETYLNQSFYLPSKSSLLMLGSGTDL